MGAGVAGALKARGGQAIEAEAMAQGPVEPGECVVTSGGRLAARYVIHAAVMGQDLRTSASLIERATRNSLLRAEAQRLASIAFPAISTGIYSFPADRAARIAVGTVASELSAAPRSLARVVFCCFSESSAQHHLGVVDDLGLA